MRTEASETLEIGQNSSWNGLYAFSKQNWVPWKVNEHTEMGDGVLTVKVVGQEKRMKEESNFSKIEANCTNLSIARRYGRTDVRLELK